MITSTWKENKLTDLVETTLGERVTQAGGIEDAFSECFKPAEGFCETGYSAEQFEIDDDQKANWFLGKLAAINSEKALIKAQAAEIVTRLDADAAQLNRMFLSNLESYAKASLAKVNDHRKSLILLYGTCKFTSVPGGPKVVDEAAAIEYCLENSFEIPIGLVTQRVVSELDKKGYLALLEETGEILPGIVLVEPRESFSIKFNEGAK